MTLYRTVADLNGGTQVAMTADEEAAFITAQTATQASTATAALRQQAQSALNASDMTALRRVKAGAAFPVEWQAYVGALRAIVATGSGTLPVQPVFPAGT